MDIGNALAGGLISGLTANLNQRSAEEAARRLEEQKAELNQPKYQFSQVLDSAGVPTGYRALPIQYPAPSTGTIQAPAMGSAIPQTSQTSAQSFITTGKGKTIKLPGQSKSGISYSPQDPAIQDLASNIANYKMPYTGSRQPAFNEALTTAIKKYNPNWSQTAYNSASKFYNSPQVQQTESKFIAAKGTLDRLSDVTDSMEQNIYALHPAEGLNIKVADLTGDPEFTRFLTEVKTFQEEYGAAIQGSPSLNEKTLELSKQLVDPNASYAQLKTAFDELRMALNRKQQTFIDRGKLPGASGYVNPWSVGEEKGVKRIIPKSKYKILSVQ